MSRKIRKPEACQQSFFIDNPCSVCEDPQMMPAKVSISGFYGLGCTRLSVAHAYAEESHEFVRDDLRGGYNED